jgi:hypothetical protein
VASAFIAPSTRLIRLPVCPSRLVRLAGGEDEASASYAH